MFLSQWPEPQQGQGPILDLLYPKATPNVSICKPTFDFTMILDLLKRLPAQFLLLLTSYISMVCLSQFISQYWCIIIFNNTLEVSPPHQSPLWLLSKHPSFWFSAFGFHLNMICIGVILLARILHGILWTSWICDLMPIINFGKPSSSFSSHISSAPFSLPT